MGVEEAADQSQVLYRFPICRMPMTVVKLSPADIIHGRQTRHPQILKDLRQNFHGKLIYPRSPRW